MTFDFHRHDNDERTYSVLELNGAVRHLLETKYSGVWIEAEVTEVTRARSGHVYFTLADPGGKAQLSAVLWKGPAMRYGSRVKPGQGVRCHGRLTLYEVRGSYQLVADRIEEAGAGVKARILAERKAKLEKEGLFDKERKRPLPAFPNCVGVVTSRDGAAFQDIIKVAGRRFPLRIVLAHAMVQGESAPLEIVRALGLLARNDDIDVVILGRGGGSSEDLDAFNDEDVVRAIAQHPQPVVSAVGHEIDVTLSDLAADLRAATPSEAAEIVVPDSEALKERLDLYLSSMEKATQRCLGIGKERHAIITRQLSAHDPRVRLKQSLDALAQAREVLARWPAQTLLNARQAFTSAREPLLRWPEPTMARAKGNLARLAASLDALSPLASLARGYAVVKKHPDHEIVRSYDQAPPGTELDITLAEGSLICEVKKTIPSS